LTISFGLSSNQLEKMIPVVDGQPQVPCTVDGKRQRKVLSTIEPVLKQYHLGTESMVDSQVDAGPQSGEAEGDGSPTLADLSECQG
jgi:hypothetical protein